MESSNRRKYYLDIIRIIATYAVIILHVASKYIGGGQYRPVLIFWDSCVRWAVPAFVMISGALFLSPYKQVTIKRLWKKNILRMFFSLIFWTAIYVLFEYWLFDLDLHSCKMYLITGYWHMWFVWMITGLYIITPFIRQIVKVPQLIKYYLVMFLFVTVLVPTLRYMIIPYMSISRSEWAAKIFTNIDTMNLKFFLGFTGYFILGYFFDTITLNRTMRRIIFLLGILSFPFGIYVNEYLTLFCGATTPFDDSFSITSFLQTIFIFNIFKYHSGWANKKISCKIITSFSACSFGIYMIHILIRQLLDRYFALNAESFDMPVIIVPLLSLLIFLVGYVISFIFHQIPVLREYVV